MACGARSRYNHSRSEWQHSTAVAWRIAGCGGPFWCGLWTCGVMMIYQCGGSELPTATISKFRITTQRLLLQLVRLWFRRMVSNEKSCRYHGKGWFSWTTGTMEWRWSGSRPDHYSWNKTALEHGAVAVKFPKSIFGVKCKTMDTHACGVEWCGWVLLDCSYHLTEPV